MLWNFPPKNLWNLIKINIDSLHEVVRVILEKNRKVKIKIFIIYLLYKVKNKDEFPIKKIKSNFSIFESGKFKHFLSLIISSEKFMMNKLINEKKDKFFSRERQGSLIIFLPFFSIN